MAENIEREIPEDVVRGYFLIAGSRRFGVCDIKLTGAYPPEFGFFEDRGLASGLLLLCLPELVRNCYDQGAKLIQVRYQLGTLRVEDDVVHENWTDILRSLNSTRLLSTVTDTQSWRGNGVIKSRQEFEKHGGSLIYSSLDSRIIADASWNPR